MTDFARPVGFISGLSLCIELSDRSDWELNGDYAGVLDWAWQLQHVRLAQPWPPMLVLDLH